MSKTYMVVFSRYAEDDLNEIINYYLSISNEHALEILEKVERRVNELKKLPERGRIVPELKEQNISEYRELIEGNYRIVYAVQDDTVIVHTVIDGRRNFEDIINEKLIRYYS